MVYDDIVLGRFIARPNRFTAQVEINGKMELCHVKDTSRLRELLLPGSIVSLQRAKSPDRKTAWDLIAVQHEKHWVNIDSQAPNVVFGQWVRSSGLFGPSATLQSEVSYGNSRFDWYVQAGARRIFVEVKGVTLVINKIARFPGAPTSRGTKHLRQLMLCMEEGYEAMMAFVVKRDDVDSCMPNDELDPDFGMALREAAARGLQIIGVTCNVAADSLSVCRAIDVFTGTADTAESKQ